MTLKENNRRMFLSPTCVGGSERIPRGICCDVRVCVCKCLNLYMYVFEYVWLCVLCADGMMDVQISNFITSSTAWHLGQVAISNNYIIIFEDKLVQFRIILLLFDYFSPTQFLHCSYFKHYQYLFGQECIKLIYIYILCFYFTTTT